MEYKFTRIACEYARDVVRGVIPVSHSTRLACERFARDLKRANDRKSAWVLNRNIIEQFCDFAESFKLPSGDFLRLQPWQVFIFANIFGWVARGDKDGYKRRFTKAFVFIPRKNGKSTLASIVALYMLTHDGEDNPQVFACATSKEQASIVFNEAKKFATFKQGYLKEFSIKPKHDRLSIVNKKTEVGYFACLSGRPGDGTNPHCAIIDEYHEHKTNAVLDAMARGAVARKNSLIFVITTAGVNTKSPCFDEYDNCKRLLRGTKGYADDSKFCMIFEPDEGTDWASDEAIIQSNPNLGIGITLERLKNDRDSAKTWYEQQAFQTKNLNMWASSGSSFNQFEMLKKLGDAPPVEEFEGCDCFCGLDMATVHDFACFVAVFTRDIGGVTHYYVYDRTYYNSARIEPFAEYASRGEIVVHTGNAIDHEKIQNDILDFSKRFKIKSLGYDRALADGVSQFLTKRLGVRALAQIPQKREVLDEPIKALTSAIDLGQFHFTGSQLLMWQFQNVYFNETNGLLFPRKLRAGEKIDTYMATLCAFQRICAQPKPRESAVSNVLRRRRARHAGVF